ncbi:toxic anion resistance protein [Deinococcus altitudinis]|uniref:toxic anion resistance protein n=1 Tax=Deinococcus altitudinis TaxID=468914 RepID=UPI0038927A07
MTEQDALPQLTPPETLTAPAPIPVVTPQQSDEMVPISAEAKAGLDERATAFLNGLMNADVHGADFQGKLGAIHNLGQDEIRQAASVSSRMLDRPMKETNLGTLSEGAQVAKGLVDLRRTVEDLDPSRAGDLFSVRKLLGIIPFGSKIEAYFDRYQSAQGHLNAILNTLAKSQDELRKDNAAIEQEKVNLWALMTKLRQYVYVGRAVDAALTERLAALDQTDPDKARIVREELLFAVRQRVTDLLTQLAVSVQGYLALDLVRRNNLELIKGVDRASTTTVSALRTAVIVAQALANQKLVLDQVSALNSTTANMIEGTSKLLRTQGAAIQAQAGSATINVDRLKAAFDNIYSALDDVSTYRLRALDTFERSIVTLQGQVDGAQKYLDKERSRASADVQQELKVASGGGELKL